MTNNGLWNLYNESKLKYPELFIEYHGFGGVDIMQYTQYDGEKDKNKPTLNVRFDKNGEIKQMFYKERKYDRGTGTEIADASILPDDLKKVYEDLKNKTLSYVITDEVKEELEELDTLDEEMEL